MTMDPNDVRAGVGDAFLEVLTGRYPFSKQDMLEAVRDGVADAFGELIAATHVISRDDLLDAIREGAFQLAEAELDAQGDDQ